MVSPWSTTVACLSSSDNAARSSEDGARFRDEVESTIVGPSAMAALGARSVRRKEWLEGLRETMDALWEAISHASSVSTSSSRFANVRWTSQPLFIYPESGPTYAEGTRESRMMFDQQRSDTLVMKHM